MQIPRLLFFKERASYEFRLREVIKFPDSLLYVGRFDNLFVFLLYYRTPRRLTNLK